MTLPLQLRAGAGAPHWVAYVSGMPWFVASSPAVIAALDADPDQKMHFFGAARSRGAPFADVFPAKQIIGLLGLEPPGAQTVTLSQSLDWVDAGGWDLRLSPRDQGCSWPVLTPTAGEPRRGSIRGIEGINAIADPRHGGDVHRGVLAVNVDAPTADEEWGTIWIQDCEQLAARITAAAAAFEITWLWLGTEAMAATAITDHGGGLYEVTVARGILRTRPRSHFVGDWEGAGSIVCDAPLGGVAHRPVALYAITLDAAGAIADWHRVRHGVVSPSVSTSKGVTRIRCNGWTDALKGRLPAREARGTLRGYTLSRPATALSDLDGFPVGAAIQIRRHPDPIHAPTIWTAYLVDAGTTEYFETWSDVSDRINDVFASMALGAPLYGSTDMSGTGYSLECTQRGVRPDGDASADSAWFVSGELAILLALGFWAAGDSGTLTEGILRGRTHTMSDVRLMCCNASGAPYRSVYANWGAVYILMRMLMHSYRAVYLHMPDFVGAAGSVIDTITQADWQGEHYQLGSHWPPAGNLRLRWSTLADSYAVGQIVEIGRTDRYWHEPQSAAVMSGRVDSLDLVNNALVLDTTAPFASGRTGTAALMHDSMAPESLGVTQWSSVLSWVIAVHGDDPWTVHPSTKIDSDEATDLLRALLGDRLALAPIPPLYQFDAIADAIDRVITHGAVTYYDQIASIDWADFAVKIDKLVTSITESYSLRIGTGDTGEPDVEVAKLITGLLGSHGLVPTWEPDVTARTERMGLRLINTVSITAALFEGRTVTETEITSPDHREDHSLTPAVQRAEIAANWDGQEYHVKVPAVDRNAYGITAHRGRTMKIEDRLTQWAIPGEAAELPEFLATLASALVARVTRPRVSPQPTRSFSVSSRRWFDMGVGRELLITSRAMSDPYSGERPLVEAPAVIMATTRDLGADDASIKVQAAMAARAVYGWAPSLDVPPTVGGGPVFSTVVDPDTVALSASPDHTYGNPNVAARTDLSWFDCYLYSAALGGLVQKQCSCDNYSVRVYERHTRTPTIHSDVEISDVDPVAGTATLTAVGLGAAWDVTAHHVVRFSPWDHADLQPCQRLFFCSSDADDVLIDAAAAVTPGHRYA